MLAAAHVISAMGRWRRVIAVLLLLCTMAGGMRYVFNFVVDNGGMANRYVAAQVVNGLKYSNRVLAVWAEPAPYCLPPVDLFGWKIVLLPRFSRAEDFHLDDQVVSVRPVDKPAPQVDHPIWTFAPISWANKPFEIVYHENENLKSN